MRYALYTTLVLIAAMLVAFPINAADERSYRTDGNKKYEILDTSRLYIYSTSVLVRKGALEKAYFFSLSGTGEILPLTIRNLKTAFPENHKFHDSLDMFRSDSSLNRYDDFHKMFKVNRLLIASEQ